MLILAGVGAICGIVLSVASVAMEAPVDERVEAVRELLPGINCGACGFAGCDTYAEAVVGGKAEITACPPGGDTLRLALGKLMGVVAEPTRRQTAVVHCNGCNEHTTEKMDYIGEPSCVYAAAIYGGPSACAYACLGLGDCAHVCPYDAVQLVNGVAKVDFSRCTGCKLCVDACPKTMIDMVPGEGVAYVFCANHDKGGIVRNLCAVGCTGCTLCAKACLEGAITVRDFLAHVDYAKCKGCGLCVPACPRGTISLNA